MKLQKHFIRITLIGLLLFPATNYSQHQFPKKEENKQSLLEKYSSYLNEENEILSMRTENAQHFKINDSLYIAKIFSSPTTAEADTSLPLTTPTTGMVFKDGGGSITKIDNTLRIQNTSATGCEYGYRAWVKYDISSIPNSSNIFEVHQFIYCTELVELFYDYLEYNVMRVDHDPITATPADLWTDIFDGTMYVYYEWVTNPPGWEWCALSTPAAFDFENALNDEDWFALGYMVKCDEDDSDFHAIFDGYLDTYPPYIIVSYNVVKNLEVINSEPNSFALYQNYPNPFNPGTTIRFFVTSPGITTLKIFNSLGETAAILVNKELTTGSYEIEWDAAGLPSGVYFYQLHSGEFIETKKMILMK